MVPIECTDILALWQLQRPLLGDELDAGLSIAILLPHYRLVLALGAAAPLGTPRRPAPALDHAETVAWVFSINSGSGV